VNFDLSSTQIAIAVAAGIVGAGYIAFILAPAVKAYGRLWERLAAGFLTLYILGTLVGIGAATGLAIVWSYDQYG
jgi:transketolase C-terminal domain/subunit